MVMSDLVQALRAYQQGDADGVMVLVSRQACDEGAAEIERLQKTVARILEPKRIVGYMVHSGAVENAALYPLSEHAEALDAADRWKAPITALVCAPGGPDASAAAQDGMTPEDDKRFNRQWDVNNEH